MRYTWSENYPDNRIIVNGVDLSTTYRMIMADGYSLGVPEAKTYTVDIPGGDGVIDLTESLVGDTLYSNREQEFTFYIIDQQNQEDFEDAKTAVSNFLHGKAYDYVLTFDPEYTYHGRFHVSSYEHQAFPSGILGAIKITIDAEPYKTKGIMSYTLNATGGKQYEFSSGRKKVHPVLTCSEPCKVNFNGTSLTVPEGTYRLNPVIFEEGVNELYLNSHQIQMLTWSDVGEDGMFAMLWATPTETATSTVYSASSSGTAVPSSWSSTYPDSGTYIWTRLTTTYSNGVKTYAYSVDYTEYEEPEGDENSATITASVTKEVTTYYTSSNSGTTIPTTASWLYYDVVGAWLDTDTEQFSYVYLYEETGDYIVFLWLRIETYYSDDTKTLVYQTTQESTYGDTYTTDISYQASLYGTSVPDGTWSSEYPTTTDYPYIWTKTVYTYSTTGYTTTSYDVEYLLAADTVVIEDSSEYAYSLINVTFNHTILDSDEDYILDSDGNKLTDTVAETEYDLEDYYTVLEWSSSKPSVSGEDNYILFTRVITNYSDGGQNVDYNAEVVLDIELVSITSDYTDSSSGTVIPDDSYTWDEDYIGDEDYTWQRYTYTFDENYVVYVYESTYNVAEAFTDSIYVTNTVTKYQYSTDPDILTGMATGRFEWVKTVTEYSDGGSTTEYVCTYNAESIGADQLRWDEIHLLYNGKEAYRRTWEDLAQREWADLSGQGDYTITWDSLDYRDVDIPDTYVTLEYDWKDL